MRFPDPDHRHRSRFIGALTFSLLVLMAAGCGGGGDSAPVVVPVVVPAYVRFAGLSGAQEAPINASTATGAATFSLDPNTRILTGTVATSGIVATAAHIHDGAPGVAGPVVFPLSGGTGGIWTVPANTVMTDAQYAALQANRYYVNIHSAAFPAGEIRGQIELRVSFAVLSGAQETPAATTTATGYGSLAVNALTGAVSGSVLTSGITGAGAHIHEAATGVAGPIIIPLTDAGGGVWTVPAGATLTPAQLASWQNGNLYVNVHTSAYPGGEIRGQLNIAAPITQTAALSGANEVPATPSTATGSAGVGIHPVTLEICGGAATTGLTGTGAHIHEAAAGAGGPIILPLGNAGGGAWTVSQGTRFTSGQFASWRAGSLYVNIHSAANPGGEIRGQLANPAGGGGTGGGTGGGGY
ncbi:MAG: CHRD domain-containing protein [Geothrix sp.]|nr:CHRD domain-containing protein [Geothrix sp.]